MDRLRDAPPLRESPTVRGISAEVVLDKEDELLSPDDRLLVDIGQTAVQKGLLLALVGPGALKSHLGRLPAGGSTLPGILLVLHTDACSDAFEGAGHAVILERASIKYDPDKAKRSSG